MRGAVNVRLPTAKSIGALLPARTERDGMIFWYLRYVWYGIYVIPSSQGEHKSTVARDERGHCF